MYALLKDLRTPARNAENYANDSLNKSAQMASLVVKNLRKFYPHIVRDIRSGAGRVLPPVKHAINTSGKELHHVAYLLRKGVHRTELYAVLAIVGYGAVKFFGCFNNRDTPSPARKIQTHIEAKPVKSAFIAAGVGFLISRVIF